MIAKKVDTYCIKYNEKNYYTSLRCDEVVPFVHLALFLGRMFCNIRIFAWMFTMENYTSYNIGCK